MYTEGKKGYEILPDFPSTLYASLIRLFRGVTLCPPSYTFLHTHHFLLHFHLPVNCLSPFVSPARDANRLSRNCLPAKDKSPVSRNKTRFPSKTSSYQKRFSLFLSLLLHHRNPIQYNAFGFQNLCTTHVRKLTS